MELHTITMTALTPVAAEEAVAVVPQFLEYGVLGAVLVVTGLALRVLFARETAAHDEQRARADRNEDQVRELNQIIRDQVLPTIAGATEAMRDVVEVMREAVEVVARAKDR